LPPSDFSVNILAVNLMFRYPIQATPEMPQGRWYPYIGGGVGVERARLSDLTTNHQENDYAPAIQGLVGIKFFPLKNLGIFAEYKRTTGWHTFDYNGAGLPPGYSEQWTIASNLVVGGIALHF
jgi:opacity protein-like surface antigen